MLTRALLLLGVAALLPGSALAQNPDPPGPGEPTALRTEHQTASQVALAVPTIGVRFTWQNLHGNWSKGAAQTQFQLQIVQNTTVNTGNATNKGEVVHDTGKVSSAAQYYQLPASAALKPGTDYAWRVQVRPPFRSFYLPFSARFSAHFPRAVSARPSSAARRRRSPRRCTSRR